MNLLHHNYVYWFARPLNRQKNVGVKDYFVHILLIFLTNLEVKSSMGLWLSWYANSQRYPRTKFSQQTQHLLISVKQPVWFTFSRSNNIMLHNMQSRKDSLEFVKCDDLKKYLYDVLLARLTMFLSKGCCFNMGSSLRTSSFSIPLGNPFIRLEMFKKINRNSPEFLNFICWYGHYILFV